MTGDHAQGDNRPHAAGVVRVTSQLLDTLEVLLEHVEDTEFHGYAILKAVGGRPGTLYKTLDRLHAAGQLSRRWQDQERSDTGPRRRYFQLTPDGAAWARALLAARRPKGGVTRRWTARLAPLDVAADDGRLLEPGPWALRRPGPAPLVTIGENRHQVGTVDSVAVDGGSGGWLCAAGTVTGDRIAEQMHAGKLRPAIEVDRVSFEVDMTVTTAAGWPVLRFAPGEVVAVALATTAAWPDVRFSVDGW